MKFPLLSICAAAMLGFSAMAVEEMSRARVIRISMETNSLWQIRISENGKINFLSKQNLTNRLSQLRLRHGDIILSTAQPTRRAGAALATWDWLSHYCESNMVAIYVCTPTEKGPDYLSLPIYHWTSPFDNPRALSAASFFYEGKFLGRGLTGYTNLVADIDRNAPQKVFILGSLYDLNRSFGPFERPYEDQEKLLDAILKKHGTELLVLNPIPGF